MLSKPMHNLKPHASCFLATQMLKDLLHLASFVQSSSHFKMRFDSRLKLKCSPSEVAKFLLSVTFAKQPETAPNEFVTISYAKPKETTYAASHTGFTP